MGLSRPVFRGARGLMATSPTAPAFQELSGLVRRDDTEGEMVERLSAVIERLLKARAPLLRRRQSPLFQRWNEVVGETLARRCRPLAVHKGILQVQVAGSVWMQELQMQKRLLLERARRVASGSGLSDIRFVLSSGVIPSCPSPRMSPRLRPLSREEEAWIDGTVRLARDPDLQEVFRRILRRHLQHRDPWGPESRRSQIIR